MNVVPATFDIIVLGAGPAGQKAAVQGAKAGRRVLLVEREAAVGGECVHRGTIPSKTLRESAVYIAGLKRRAAGLFKHELDAQTTVESLMDRLAKVLKSHERFITEQIARNHIDSWQGRARFVAPHEIEVMCIDGSKKIASAEFIVVATGSRPRQPAEIAIDHEHVLDSDSILSMLYLPQSLAVFGAGVIACEFASIFQSLGVQVTLIDKGDRPLAFLDPELTDHFVREFQSEGGRFLGGAKTKSVEFDGASAVITKLESGEEIITQKALVALGRKASLAGLDVQNAGLAPSDRGFLTVDANCATAVPHIYAAGDVIGPPALATTAMEQGRRAVRHALGLDLGAPAETIPIGIYTIPEIGSVGLSEAEAIKRHGRVIVGRSKFEELARGQINGATDGLLKLIADASGRHLLGAQIIGEGATELVHLAQMAMLGKLEIDTFVDNIFNFPTLAEGYRVAALDIAGQRVRLRAVG